MVRVPFIFCLLSILGEPSPKQGGEKGTTGGPRVKTPIHLRLKHAPEVLECGENHEMPNQSGVPEKLGVIGDLQIRLTSNLKSLGQMTRCVVVIDSLSNQQSAF